MKAPNIPRIVRKFWADTERYQAAYERRIRRMKVRTREKRSRNRAELVAGEGMQFVECASCYSHVRRDYLSLTSTEIAVRPSWEGVMEIRFPLIPRCPVCNQYVIDETKTMKRLKAELLDAFAVYQTDILEGVYA